MLSSVILEHLTCTVKSLIQNRKYQIFVFMLSMLLCYSVQSKKKKEEVLGARRPVNVIRYFVLSVFLLTVMFSGKLADFVYTCS